MGGPDARWFASRSATQQRELRGAGGARRHDRSWIFGGLRAAAVPCCSSTSCTPSGHADTLAIEITIAEARVRVSTVRSRSRLPGWRRRRWTEVDLHPVAVLPAQEYEIMGTAFEREVRRSRVRMWCSFGVDSVRWARGTAAEPRSEAPELQSGMCSLSNWVILPDAPSSPEERQRKTGAPQVPTLANAHRETEADGWTTAGGSDPRC